MDKKKLFYSILMAIVVFALGLMLVIGIYNILPLLFKIVPPLLIVALLSFGISIGILTSLFYSEYEKITFSLNKIIRRNK